MPKVFTPKQKATESTISNEWDGCDDLSELEATWNEWLQVHVLPCVLRAAERLASIGVSRNNLSEN